MYPALIVALGFALLAAAVGTDAQSSAEVARSSLEPSANPLNGRGGVVREGTPAGSVSPSLQNYFGREIGLGPSEAKTFTLSSTGTASLDVLDIGIGNPTSGGGISPNNQFQITGGTCVAGVSSLSNGQSCTVIAVFDPSTVGDKSAYLYLRVNSRGSSLETLPGYEYYRGAQLMGVGTLAIGSLAPTSRNFGNRQIADGPTAATTFTLSSTGTANLTVPGDGVSLTGANPDQFQISGTCFGASLSNGQSCTVRVVFDPSTVGAKAATLSLATNDGTKTASLTGTATSPGASLSPTSINFGSQSAVEGRTAERTVTVESSGVTPLTIASMGISQTANNFEISGGSCTVGTTPIASGASCTITIVFDPLSAGTKTGALSVETNAGTRWADLVGTGTAPVGSLAPNSSAFGSRQIADGPTAATTFTLSSTGTANLTVPSDGVSLTGANPDQFQISGGTCLGASLSNGQSCTVNVVFDPSTVGAKATSLSITTNAGTKSAMLTGTGIRPAGAVSPASYSFGGKAVAEGATPEAVFQLLSSGDADLSIISFALTGQDATDFQVTSSGTCIAGVTRIATGSGCSVTVAFDPSSPGSKTAALEIETNDGSKQAVLLGVGFGADVQPAGTMNVNSYSFGSKLVNDGATADAIFILSSNGGADLTIPTGGIYIRGQDTGEFRMRNGGTCSAGVTSLASSEVCSVLASFDPAGAGIKSAELVVQTNSGDKIVRLQGVGSNLPVISAAAAPSSTSLSVRVRCGSPVDCVLKLSGNKVGNSAAALVPRTAQLEAGSGETIRLSYSSTLRRSLKGNTRIRVVALDAENLGASSVILRR